MLHLRFVFVGLFAASMSLCALSCGDDESSAGGAEGEGETESFEQVSSVSDCGGFAATGPALTLEDALTIDPATYCEAQVLHWEYDAASKRLEFIDARVQLNCCGAHSMSVAEVAGVLVLTERDEATEGRCNCECIFDFGVTLTGIEGGQRAIQLVLDVVELPEWPQSDGPTTAYEGTINLADGAGQIVLDDQPSFWCGEG